MTVMSSPHIIPLIRKLRDAGVSQDAAEAIGEAMEQMPTKDELYSELKLELKAELKSEFQEALRTELNAQEERLEKRMTELEKRMTEMEKRIMERMKSEIGSAAADNFRNLVYVIFAAQGLTVALIVLLLK